MSSIADAWDAGWTLARTLGWKLAFVFSVIPVLVFTHRVRGRGWF